MAIYQYQEGELVMYNCIHNEPSRQQEALNGQTGIVLAELMYGDCKLTRSNEMGSMVAVSFQGQDWGCARTNIRSVAGLIPSWEV